MSVPTEAQLEEALAEAAKMRESGKDEHFVAKALLNYHYRVDLLEAVLRAVKHYLHSGLAPHEHAALIRAMNAAEAASEELGTEHEDFGLEGMESRTED